MLSLRDAQFERPMIVERRSTIEYASLDYILPTIRGTRCTVSPARGILLAKSIGQTYATVGVLLARILPWS